jgi:site-specific DNA recombinase
MMIRAAIYARYSSDRQNERSVGDQIEVCTRHALGKGWEVARIFSDAAISGSAMANRAGILDALAAAECGEFDILLAEDEDRIARNLEHLAHVTNRIEDAGAALWTISSGKVETMHVAFKGAMAQDFIKNLSAKTKRGMRANAERGAATGSRLYGYRSEPGGALAIVDNEAEIIRRIFAAYISGDTARIIATALNAEGVPSPHGGLWNASSIAGSRQRGNGILHSELYVGVKVWGRMDVKKDRTTGKRRPIMRPPEAWQRTPVPDMRIVDDEAWQAVRARKDRNSHTPYQVQRRPGLFSGLLKCGDCGGTYTTYTGARLICANHREKGTCSNGRTPLRAEVETKVLETLRDQLLSPEAVASYVRAYHRAAMDRKADQTAQRAPLERRLGEVRRGIERVVDAIVRGASNTAMEERMAELERERLAIESQLEMIAEDRPVATLHPHAAETYANIVRELHASLRDYAAGATAAERKLADEIRGLIDRVVIRPLTQQRGGPIDIEIFGTLARFMGQEEHPRNVVGGGVVAGGGLEPPTCGL